MADEEIHLIVFVRYRARLPTPAMCLITTEDRPLRLLYGIILHHFLQKYQLILTTFLKIFKFFWFFAFWE